MVERGRANYLLITLDRSPRGQPLPIGLFCDILGRQLQPLDANPLLRWCRRQQDRCQQGVIEGKLPFQFVELARHNDFLLQFVTNI